MNSKLPREQTAKVNKRPYIGVGILLWKGDHLLLGQRKDSHGEPRWQFPGGHLETGETVIECAVREVFEETGLDIGFAQHACFSNQMFSAGDREYVTLYVKAAYLSGEPKVKEPDKCESWQWFPHDQLPEPLFLPIVNLMKQSPDLSVYHVGSETRADVQK